MEVLVVLFCMAGSSVCSEEEKPLLREVTPQQCVIAAQELIPVMLNNFTDPDNWQVRQFGCKKSRT